MSFAVWGEGILEEFERNAWASVISSATQATQSAEKTGRKLGNQVIRKGYMSIHNLGIMKGGKWKVRNLWPPLRRSMGWLDQLFHLQGCYGCTILLYVLLLMANLLLVFIVWVLHDCCTIMPSFTPTGNSKRENLVLQVKKFGICFVVSWLFILISKNLWLVFHLP